LSCKVEFTKQKLSSFDGPPTNLCAFQNQDKIVVGDSAGKIYVYSADTFDLIGERKSMGQGVEMLGTDDVDNIIYTFGNQIVVLDDKLETVYQMVIDTASLGPITFLKTMQNMIVLATESSTFLLLDSLVPDKVTTIKPKGWVLSSKVTFLRSQSNSIKNLGGTDLGQLFTFDLN
jgi:hypothetical protein